MKKGFLLFMLLAVILTGCSGEKGSVIPAGNPGSYVEPEAVYPWMAGESPVPNRRMGIVRSGVNNDVHAVSSEGVYFMTREEEGKFILYVDHGSDKVIKLCGRADCSHDDRDCTAFLPGCTALSYYGGYLYAVMGDGSDQEAKLLRMDPDGSNRIEVLDLLAFAKEHGGDFVRCELITEGIVLFVTKRWVKSTLPDGSTEMKSENLDRFIYRLCEPAEGPVLQQSAGVMYNCGNTVLSYSQETKYGGEYGSYWSWDPDTEKQVYLTDHPGVPGYFDDTHGYYYKEGNICRLSYETRQEEVMVETGLEGNYILKAFPECMVLAYRGFDTADPNLYIYNWNYELVDTVEIKHTEGIGAAHLLIAETAERLILTDKAGGPPRYYINKSELGTADVKVHAFVMA